MKALKISLLVGLIFLAGVAVGVVGTRVAIRHWMRTAIQRPETVQTLVERRLKWRLRLDATQQAQVHEILTGTREQFAELRREYRPQVMVIVSNADAQISAVLTPAQQQRYERFKEENRALLPAAGPGQGKDSH